jgi:hypothetical protein
MGCLPLFLFVRLLYFLYSRGSILLPPFTVCSVAFWVASAACRLPVGAVCPGCTLGSLPSGSILSLISLLYSVSLPLFLVLGPSFFNLFGRPSGNFL